MRPTRPTAVDPYAAAHASIAHVRSGSNAVNEALYGVTHGAQAKRSHEGGIIMTIVVGRKICEYQRSVQIRQPGVLHVSGISVINTIHEHEQERQALHPELRIASPSRGWSSVGHPAPFRTDSKIAERMQHISRKDAGSEE